MKAQHCDAINEMQSFGKPLHKPLVTNKKLAILPDAIITKRLTERSNDDATKNKCR